MLKIPYGTFTPAFFRASIHIGVPRI
jgi:hypothetical protein